VIIEDSPFSELVTNPESDERRESIGRVEDQLDRAIGYLVGRDFPMCRKSLVLALRELNSVEIV
jgi:hypothetical protein